MARLTKPVDYKLPLQMSNAGYPVMAQGRTTLEDSIRTVLLTTPGERVRLPLFGSWLRQLIFANMSEPNIARAQDEIVRALNDWEPRVAVEDIRISTQDTTVTVLIVWRPSGSDLPVSTELEFRL